MNINEIKKIKLADYLQSLGYTPVKQQGRNGVASNQKHTGCQYQRSKGYAHSR